MSTIVVGVDDSAYAREALKWAVTEARLRSSRLVVAHVYEVAHDGLFENLRSAAASLSSSEPDVPPGVRSELRSELADAQRRSQAVARQMVDRSLDGVVTTDLIVDSEVMASTSPAKGLIELAQEADLLVVGQRGRGGFAGLLLGTVAQQCVRHAPCPVVVVPEVTD